MKKCVNCGTSLRESKICYEIANLCPEMILLLETQLKRENIEDDDLCERCFNQVTNQVLALQTVKEESEEDPFEDISHLNEEVEPHVVKEEIGAEDEKAKEEEMITEVNRCAWCLQMLKKQMLKHRLTDGPEKDYIVADIFPRKITPANRVCDICWLQVSRILNPIIKKRNKAKIETATSFALDLDEVSPKKILKITKTGDESNNSSPTKEYKIFNSTRISKDSKDNDAVKEVSKGNIVETSNNDSNQEEDEVWIPSEDTENNEKICNSGKEESSDDISSDKEDKEWQPSMSVEYSFKNNSNLPVSRQHAVKTRANDIDAIVLPHYRTVGNNGRRCFVRDCKGTERRQIPVYMKKVLMESYNLCVPCHARACSEHVREYYRDWTILKDIDYRNEFTATEIENVLDLLRKGD